MLSLITLAIIALLIVVVVRLSYGAYIGVALLKLGRATAQARHEARKARHEVESLRGVIRELGAAVGAIGEQARAQYEVNDFVLSRVVRPSQNPFRAPFVPDDSKQSQDRTQREVERACAYQALGR